MALHSAYAMDGTDIPYAATSCSADCLRGAADHADHSGLPTPCPSISLCTRYANLGTDAAYAGTPQSIVRSLGIRILQVSAYAPPTRSPVPPADPRARQQDSFEAEPATDYAATTCFKLSALRNNLGAAGTALRAAYALPGTCYAVHRVLNDTLCLCCRVAERGAARMVPTARELGRRAGGGKRDSVRPGLAGA
eukprot:1477317-Rhodomonas_salina.5